MKKQFFLILFLSFSLALNANMASPIQAGTLGANPFLNTYVSVLHETILITMNEDFQYANFDIEYNIESEKDGIKIPLLFYASEYFDDFNVTIDGKPIELKVYNDFWDEYNIKNKKLTNFDYLYNANREDVSELNTEFKNGKSETIRIDDFIYFETNIDKGKHTIKVSYKASRWQYKQSRVNETSFRYALSPTKYWKSFGTLEVKIDASKVKDEISTNLGKPIQGDINAVSNFHFNELPVDILQINLEPNLSGFIKLLLKIETFGLTLIFILIFVAYHIKLLFKYRKKNPKSKFSIIALFGGLIIPFLFVFGLIFSSLLIDYFIGIHASGRSSYGAFYSFLLLPKYLLFYLLFSFVLDLVFKKLIQRQI